MSYDKWISIKLFIKPYNTPMIQKWTYTHQQNGDEPKNTFFSLKPEWSKRIEAFMCVIRKLRKCKINKASSFDGILNGSKDEVCWWCYFNIFLHISLSKFCFSPINERDFRDLGNITYLLNFVFINLRTTIILSLHDLILSF